MPDFKALLGSDKKLDRGHPFLEALLITNGIKGADGKTRTRLDLVQEEPGLFRGQGNPTLKGIRDEMARIATSHGFTREQAGIPETDPWFNNFRQPRQPARQMQIRHAFLLAACFGLSVDTFGPPGEETYDHAVRLSADLRRNRLNPTLADGSIDALAALAQLRGGGAVTVDELERLVAERGPAENCRAATPMPIRTNQSLGIEVVPPADFSIGCEVLLFERDHGGGVYCYAPSSIIPRRGYVGDRILLPVDAGNGKLAVGTTGKSLFITILNRGDHLALPDDWWDDRRNPVEIATRLEPLIDQLATRDPATWRVLTQVCQVEAGG